MPQTFSILGIGLLVSEIILGLRRRSTTSARSQDQGTLLQLWLIIAVSVTAAAWNAALESRLLIFPNGNPRLAIGVFVAGTALRWWSITHLGKFFTVNVAIAEDHRVIDTGPYRLIRHPSYSGLLLQFAGLALALNQWVSAFILLLPTFLGLRRRMQVEEQALLLQLGEEYQNYCTRTKRLVPFLF